MEEGRLKIRVTVPPEEGKANRAVIELLAKSLKVPKSSIRIKRGTTGRIKTLEIEGISLAKLQEKLGIPVEEKPVEVQKEGGHPKIRFELQQKEVSTNETIKEIQRNIPAHIKYTLQKNNQKRNENKNKTRPNKRPKREKKT
ncbi:DUF167 domain-containing protein [Balnearium lithotrophicum]|uniref:DUF167 domain-containing protein n=1 Tax=Balnearium lithotrophicum TaxID=223788 RepID=UPI001FE826E2|nr:DUF167 domain-containing protein [Balnearium lithotrophicum]